jgi:mRNA interferase RelE/StbE
MFKVSITSQAERELKRLDRPVKNRIVPAILALASDPRPPGCLKVRSVTLLFPLQKQKS